MMLLIIFFFTYVTLSAPQADQVCGTIYLRPENDFIGVVNARYHYTCGIWNTGDNVTVQWYLNNTIYRNDKISGIYYIESSFGIASILVINNASLILNNTVFTCLVTFSNGINCRSSNSKLILQGKVSKVTDLETDFNFTCISNGTILISWKAPYTLDISRLQHDIEYEVSINYGSSQELSMNTTDNTYTITLPNIHLQNASCDSFNITVLSFNDAGIGESAIIITTPLNEEKIVVNVIEGHYFAKQNITYFVHTIPGICEVQVSFNDRKNHQVVIDNENVQVINSCNNESMIVISTMGLDIEDNRHYLATFNFSNSNGSITSINISTYDIQDLLIDNDLSVLSVVFLKNTTASGALLLFCELEDVHPTLIPIDINYSKNYSIPSFLSSCDVEAFDIEVNGTLIPGKNSPAIDQMRIPALQNKDNIGVSGSPKVQYCSSIVSDNKIVKLYCSCDDQSEHIIGYQTILVYHMDSSVIIYANSTSCSKEVTLEVEKDGFYHVAVFVIKETGGIVGSIMYYAGNTTVGMNSTNMSTENSSSTVAAGFPTTEYISIVAVTAIVGNLIIICTVVVITCCCIRKTEATKSGNYNLEDRRTERTESELYVIQRIQITDLDKIYQATYEKWESEWYSYGLKLEISEDELNNIEENNHGDCLRKMLQVWLTKYPATWDILKCACDPDHADLKERLSVIARANSVPT